MNEYRKPTSQTSIRCKTIQNKFTTAYDPFQPFKCYCTQYCIWEFDLFSGPGSLGGYPGEPQPMLLCVTLYPTGSPKYVALKGINSPLSL